jgi:two-component system, cell cycle sensor histidine kinase and response regulator CckA
VFDHSPTAMLLCEVGTLAVLAANQLAAELHGATPQELNGKSLLELRRVPDLTAVMLKRSFGREVALGFGYHQRADGTSFAAQLTVHPSELDGQPAWLCVLRSLDQVLQPRDGEQDRRLFEAVGRVAGGVAHDINNLMSVVLSFVSLAVSQVPEESTTREDLAEIRGAAERAAALTKQLLGLSRKVPSTAKPEQLNEIVKRLEKLLRRLVEDHLVLDLDLDPDLDPITVDASQVERLLVQLVSEARRTSPRGTRLLIETRNLRVEGAAGTERHVMLSVSDEQGSLSPELAALSSYVDHGNAWLESEPGTGARFVIWFPSLSGKVTAPPAARRTSTVLVVQDNPHLRKTIKTYFSREGYRVLEAESTFEAMQLVERDNRIDLVLTDYALPDGNGPDLLRALRRHVPAVKSLVAIGNPEQRAAITEDDRTAVITKPFDLQQFGALIQRLLDDRSASRR